MSNLSFPLRIEKGRLAQNDQMKKSIDAFLSLLITTPIGSCVSNPEFGFVFNNLRFEIFNEREGVVDSLSSPEVSKPALDDSYYEKKISGSSKNLNTFAAELRDAIMKFEQRLQDVVVTMTYIREERHIYISVKGVMIPSKEPYQYTQIIRIWN